MTKLKNYHSLAIVISFVYKFKTPNTTTIMEQASD